MKTRKLLLSALVFSTMAVFNNAFSQELKSIPNPLTPSLLVNHNYTFSSRMMTLDTLVPPTWSLNCFTSDTAPFVCGTLDYAMPVDSGYLFGNNVYYETECAQRYSMTGNISEVLVMYCHKNGSSGSTAAKIYSVNAGTKEPQTVLGTSSAVSTGSIVPFVLTSYTFSSPVAVAGEFAAAVVFPTVTGDTVAVTSSKMGCATTDSLSWSYFPFLGGWYNAIETGGQMYNVDLAIYPVVDVPTGTGRMPVSRELTLHGAYPNPAASFAEVRFSLSASSEVSVVVFDITGQVVCETKNPYGPGEHRVRIQTDHLAGGNYFYTVHAATGELTGKFAVSHK